LRDEVFPRRQNLLTIAGRIAAINEQQLTAGNDQVVSLLLHFQTRVLVTLIAAQVLRLGMAAFSTRRILTLEDHARLRYEDVADARRNLKKQSRSHVETIKGLVEGTARVVRNMALLLRPSMLDDLGLIPALKWQARESAKTYVMDIVSPLNSSPTIFRTNTRRASIRSYRKSCTTANVILARPPSASGWERLMLIQADGRDSDVAQMIQERLARLGGKSSVHFKPGGGTTLSLELPSPRTSGAPTLVKPIRILLADDHTVVRPGLRLLLESQPEFSVVAEAADGRQAVEQAEATQPDVAEAI
jgi:CheY-like chemotaxis protein